MRAECRPRISIHAGFVLPTAPRGLRLARTPSYAQVQEVFLMMIVKKHHRKRRRQEGRRTHRGAGREKLQMRKEEKDEEEEGGREFQRTSIFYHSEEVEHAGSSTCFARIKVSVAGDQLTLPRTHG